MSPGSEDTPSPSVVAAIVVADATALPDTLEAVRSQVYEPGRIVVIGGGDGARHMAGAEDLPWAPSLERVLAAVTPQVTHLWIVRDRGLPRPDALGSLLAEADRVGAGIAGSKVLDASDPDTMLAVGIATDVFGVPYTGLDGDEVDQGQYDVVRDVAAVSGISLLIRRDLARGLQGPDAALAPLSAAIDLCQRARLRGGRVVVVPSSEVRYPADAIVGSRWREDAGRVRGMLKSYGLVTLLWAIPMLMLTSLAESILAPFAGQWRFFDWVKAWLWNLGALPATIRLRSAARKGRDVGDAELFRFQRRGSVALGRQIATIADRIRNRLPGEDRLSLEGLGRDLRSPAFVTGLLALLFILIAVRSIWARGLPAVGYSLPFPADGWQGVLAYAGGWNPAGLGGTEMLRPAIAVFGLVSRLLFNDVRLAEYAFAFGAYAFGVWGMVRLLRSWSIKAAPGVVAGIVYVAGPAAQGIGANTDLGTLFALGALPWAVRIPLARWPRTWWGRIGRIAATAAAVAVVAALSPLLLVLPAAALALWAVLNLSDGAGWRSALVAALGAALAVPLLLPWVRLVDLEAFVTAGDAYWQTSIVVAVAAAITAFATIVAAPTRLALVAGWGAVLVTGGALLARSSSLGLGVEVESAALAAVALGSAGIVGSAIEAITRVTEIQGWRRVVMGIGTAASVFVVVAALVPLLGGRASLPGDRFRDAFEFTSARPGNPADSRILVVGPPDQLPGDSRALRAAHYRVVSAPMPQLWEAWLPDPLSGDDALAGALEVVIDGDTQRAGQLLAPFGIRWIVVMGDTTSGVDSDPWATAWLRIFEGQLDLVPLGGGLSHPTFANDEVPAARAVTTRGTTWPKTPDGYAGTPEAGARVTVGENANGRWGPGEWQQVDWRNEVSAQLGVAVFDAIDERRSQAMGAGIGFLVLLGFAWWGRRRG